ncbi:MAG: hypothetical protein MR637_02120 [Clostridiales bacterium]|nr:hypothetical protein [Clostridiales bacterium]
MDEYIVYIRVGDAGRITAVNSSAFLPDTTGWEEIDSGYGDKYHHAQGNYLPGPLYNERGICRYKLVDGKPVERTQEEMDADYVEPEPKPSTDERVAQLEAQNEALLECLLEMSEIVYA